MRPFNFKPPSSVFFISRSSTYYGDIGNVCVCLSCRLQEEGERGAGRFPPYLAAHLMGPPGQFLEFLPLHGRKFFIIRNGYHFGARIPAEF
jgi:hypothetical protein